MASTRKGYATIQNDTSGATKLCLRHPTAPHRIAWTQSRKLGDFSRKLYTYVGKS
ncbi:hypothetical protein Scep_010180 [Stephania cephalantha]|uniref:Uncharacterized protein n=1 Tax=Stephania cephalantha TaxID=152367 RepID=A0AAP0PEZ3_9MAGN